MDDLWSRPGEDWSTVREVHGRLASRGLAYTTVMTVMERLARKGLVEQERKGRAFRYRPRADRAGLTAELMRGALDDVGPDERGSALLAFVSEASPEDLATLRAALERLAT